MRQKEEDDRLRLQELKDRAAAEAYNPWGQPGAGAPPAARQAAYQAQVQAQGSSCLKQHADKAGAFGQKEGAPSTLPAATQGPGNLAAAVPHSGTLTQATAFFSLGGTMHMTPDERDAIKKAALMEQQAELRKQCEERKAARELKEEQERLRELEDQARIERVS